MNKAPAPNRGPAPAARWPVQDSLSAAQPAGVATDLQHRVLSERFTGLRAQVLDLADAFNALQQEVADLLPPPGAEALSTGLAAVLKAPNAAPPQAPSVGDVAAFVTSTDPARMLQLLAAMPAATEALSWAYFERIRQPAPRSTTWQFWGLRHPAPSACSHRQLHQAAQALRDVLPAAHHAAFDAALTRYDQDVLRAADTAGNTGHTKRPTATRGPGF